VANYKVKYRGEVHDITWNDKRKPTKDELRLAISNKILEKDAPPPLSDKYELTEPSAIPSPDIFTPKNRAQRFIEKFEPHAFDPVRPDRSMFSFDSSKMSDIASRAPKPLRKPLAFTGSAIGEIGTSLFSDPESVLIPGLVKGYKRPSVLPDLPEPAATSLELPDIPRDFANEPVPRGSSTYGITPRPTSDPMLAHVPERLQPPSPTQQYFENMLPSTMRERIKGAAELGDDFVPAAPDIPTRSSEVRGTYFKGQDAVANDIQRKAREAADKSNIPEFKSTIDEVGDDIHNVSDDPGSSLSARNIAEAKNKRDLNYAAKSLFESGDTELKKMGDAGKKLWRIIADRDHLIRRESQAFRKRLEGSELEDDVKIYEKVAETIDKELGPQIAELVKQTPDPERTKVILDNHFGRQIPDPTRQYVKAFNDKVKAFQALTKLQTFAIKNVIGGNINTWLHTPSKVYFKTLKDSIIKSKAMGEFEDAAGATWNINKSIAEGITNDWSMKYYGGNWSENFNRKIAAWTGRGYARQLFDELKTNPTDQFKRGRLEELLLDDADNILSQEALTPRQELVAGGRHAEITQGLNIGRRMPTLWNNEYAQLPLVFRKYAFQQTKELKDAIKNDSTKLVKLFALSQLSGEALGALRAGTVGGIKGAIKGDVGKGVEEEFTGRTEYIGRYLKNIPVFGPQISENDTVNRIVGNVMEGWGLGLAADLMEGMAGGPMSFAKTLLGPAVSQIADIGGAVGTFNAPQLGRELLRAAPIPYVGGAGLQRGILPTPWQRKQSEEDDTRKSRQSRKNRKGRK